MECGGLFDAFSFTAQSPKIKIAAILLEIAAILAALPNIVHTAQL